MLPFVRSIALLAGLYAEPCIIYFANHDNVTDYTTPLAIKRPHCDQ
jgi:hypothetical protein